MKKFRAIALIGATALVATGCSAGGGGGEGSADGTGPISIWLSNNEQEVAWGTAVVEAWNAEHPDEQVKAQEIPAGSSSEEAITAAITAGTAPCLVYNVAPAAVSGWVKQGGLVDLSAIDGGADYITERGGDVDAYASDGSFYQLPWKSNPVMVMYNKALFEAAGIDPEDPQMNTYDSFLEGSRAIVDSGVQSAIWPAPTSEFYQPWFDFYPLYLAETDGTMLVEDGKATFDSDAGRTVSEFWKTFYDEKLSPNEASTDDAMSAGTTAMRFAGPWAIPSYADTVDVGFMPVPTSDGRENPTTFADSKSVSMFTACENQGTAWEFLKFSTSEESDGQLARGDRSDADAHRPHRRLRRLLRREPELRGVRRAGREDRRRPQHPELRRGMAGVPRRVLLRRDLRQGVDRRLPRECGDEDRRARRRVTS